MPSVTGFTSLISKLKQRLQESLLKDNTSVIVGYTQEYSIYVHEDTQALHGSAYNVEYAEDIKAGRKNSRGPNQQAKFLEQPARELNNTGELSRILTEAKKRGVSLEQALLLCGLRIQRESQELVPVDTGLLRASAFTRIDKEGK